MKNFIRLNNPGTNSSYPEDISIVMAVYNHEATVAEAIESALMQEMPFSSVIHCLNDASTDNSAEVLDSYAKKYPEKIKIYTSNENQGTAKLSFYHNQPSVNGRYWCMLEGDDYWTSKDKLSKQITFLNRNEEYVGCSCNTIMKNEMTGKESVIKPDKNMWNLMDLILFWGRYAFYVHTSSVVWRNVFLEKGFFLPPAFKNKSAFGDVMLMHMMLFPGGKIRNLPEEMSCYRVTGRGIWTSKSKDEQQKLNKLLLKNIHHMIPFKYKFAKYLQFLRCYSNQFKKLIPGPINEKPYFP